MKGTSECHKVSNISFFIILFSMDLKKNDFIFYVHRELSELEEGYGFSCLILFPLLRILNNGAV